MMTNVKWMCLAAVAGSLCLNARAAAPASLRGGASAPTNVAPAVWAKIAPQLKAARYAFEADVDGAFKARNPAHGFDIVADAAGVRVKDGLVLRAVELVEATPSSLADEESGIRRRAKRYGGQGDAASTLLPQNVRPVAQGARLEYRRPSTSSGLVVTEWFENREEGLEQGFTIAEVRSAPSELQLLVDIAGARTVKVEADGRRARITDEQGRDFGYGGLKAWDATGRSLACRLEEVGNQSSVFGVPPSDSPLSAFRLPPSSSLLIVCDAQNAVYPVTIDPVLTSMEKKLTASAGAASDYFGISVSVAGDVALVGAGQDDAPGADSGSAYVFERNAGGTNAWGEVKKLTASDGAGGDQFGISVSVAGDVDFIPTDQYDEADAVRAFGYARQAAAALEKVLKGLEPQA